MSLAGSGATLWSTYDAARFHTMAEAIIDGFTPYVDFVDPKPPLLFFTVALMDIAAPPGSIDTPAVGIVNVVSALLIWQIGRKDYGAIAGYAAGLLYLVSAAFVQGYFLLSEQFSALLLLSAFIAARNARYIPAGLLLGLACGFKQYAILAAVPLIYMMYARGAGRYHLLILPAAFAVAAPFIVLIPAYGADACASALYWTFGIGPEYLGGGLGTVPAYRSEDVLACAAAFLFGITMILPAVLFAVASVAKRGLQTIEERALGLFVLAFLSTLLIRQYLHYWILLLPFLALLACREFADSRKEEEEEEQR
jgi:hypothetical protein